MPWLGCSWMIPSLLLLCAMKDRESEATLAWACPVVAWKALRAPCAWLSGLKSPCPLLPGEHQFLQGVLPGQTGEWKGEEGREGGRERKAPGKGRIPPSHQGSAPGSLRQMRAILVHTLKGRPMESVAPAPSCPMLSYLKLGSPGPPTPRFSVSLPSPCRTVRTSSRSWSHVTMGCLHVAPTPGVPAAGTWYGGPVQTCNDLPMSGWEGAGDSKASEFPGG